MFYLHKEDAVSSILIQHNRLDKFCYLNICTAQSPQQVHFARREMETTVEGQHYAVRW